MDEQTIESPKSGANVLTILIGITLFLTIINVFGTFNLYGKMGSPTAAAVVAPSVPSAADQPSAAPSKVEVSADDDAVLGDPKAPVTIIEFSDFQCPYCGRAYTQAIKQIEEQYVKTGKVKIVHRDFPLSFHENAQKAAEAAECAGDQGKYYEMADKLYTNQGSLAVSNLKQYAKDLGLDTTKFDTCLDSGAQTAETQKDASDGAAAGVSGTPAFFINGIPLVGAQPFSEFQKIIDAELAK